MMKRVVPAALAAILSGCATQTPEQQVVERAAAALGGRERVIAVRTLTLEDGSGRQYNLGQDMTPGAKGQTFAVSQLARRYDVPATRMRTELIRTPDFVYFAGQAPQRSVQGLDNTVGFNISANGTASRAGDAATRDRRIEFHHHPVTLLRVALADGARLGGARVTDTERRVDVTLPDNVTLTLVTDDSGLPTRIESPAAHPNLGDVRLTTRFADYQDVSGLKLPATITNAVDDFVTGELRFGRQLVDATVDLTAPAPAAAAPAPTPAAPNVVVQDVAPGVWLLAGQSHHTAAIELSDQILLVDAPQSEARMLAVLAKARELRPGKRVGKVITTHHHFDHTAGIRAAIADGIAVVTHAGNRAFFEEISKRPFTIQPDTLAKSPKPATIETVDSELVLKDALRVVGIYHVAGNPHSDTMLMVHLPAERVLIEVDAFSPGSPVNPYAANLFDNIAGRKLAVDRVVSLHGPIATFDELRKATPQAGTR